MILLKTKLTLGSRKYFLPESPSLQMIACCTRRFRSYSTMFSRVFVPSHLRFPSTVNPYEKLLTLAIHTIIPRWSCYCKMSRNTLCCSENPLSLLPCSSLPHEYPYWKFLALVEYPLIPSCSCVSQKSSKYYSISRKSYGAFGSWNSCLLALWLIPLVS